MANSNGQGVTLDMSTSVPVTPPKGVTLDMSTSVPLGQSASSEPSSQQGAAVPSAKGLQPIRNVRLRPGESMYRRYSTIDPQATKDVVAGALPPVGAAIGEIYGPVGAGIGAGIGTQGTRLLGQRPTVKQTAENVALYGGTSALLKYAVAPGLSWAKNFLGLGEKTAPESWAAANEAMGVSKRDVTSPLVPGSETEFYHNPGRSVVDYAGVKPEELARMTPDEAATRIAPAWKSAGQQVHSVADVATKNGTTIDLMQAMSRGFDQIDNPQVRATAEKTVNRFLSDTFKVDPTDPNVYQYYLKNMSPNDVLALRQRLWDGLPRGYQRQIYGPVTQALKKAVPQIVPADQAFSELTTALESLGRKRGAQAIVTQPSPAAALWQRIPPSVKKAVLSGAGAGLGYGVLRDILPSGK